MKNTINYFVENQTAIQHRTSILYILLNIEESENQTRKRGGGSTTKVKLIIIIIKYLYFVCSC
jgi:hypothetical protein